MHARDPFRLLAVALTALLPLSAIASGSEPADLDEFDIARHVDCWRTVTAAVQCPDSSLLAL